MKHDQQSLRLLGPWDLWYPGVIVRHFCGRSLGIIIAVDDQRVTVMWSGNPVGTLPDFSVVKHRIVTKNKALKVTW